jgi:TonB family protein
MAEEPHMKHATALLFAGCTLISSIANAQQMSPVGRPYLTLGVPAPARQVGCGDEDAHAKAAGWNLEFGVGIYRTCQPHVVAPTRITSVKPLYTPEAMKARITGTVIVGAVIGTDGSVQDVRVLQSVDTFYGLDAAAVDAVRRSSFTPGRLGDKTVPVLVIIEHTYTLR